MLQKIENSWCNEQLVPVPVIEGALQTVVRKERRATRRVLVVEDTPDIRKLMQFMLETSGVEVTAVGDGRSAAHMIADWPAPNLVVMDRMLPFFSGDELIRRIRDDAAWARVPIVVVSAKARSEEVAQSHADGANAYITKPFNPKHFIDMVENLM